MKVQIETAKNNSQRGPNFNATALISTPETRAFYRYSHGELVEFELTRYNRVPVRLTDEDQEGLTEFYK